MTDTNTTLKRLESANKVPSIDMLPGGALSSEELLARTEQGIGALKETGPITYSADWHQPTKRAYGPVIAVAAAAAVLVAFGLVASLAPPGDVGQGDEPAPTTTLAPGVVEAVIPAEGLAWRQITPTGSRSHEQRSHLDRSRRPIPADRRIHRDSGYLVRRHQLGDIVHYMHDFSQHELAAECVAGWQDTIIAYWLLRRPGLHVHVIHGDGTIATHDFDADIAAVGIGPRGMVVIGFQPPR